MQHSRLFSTITAMAFLLAPLASSRAFADKPGLDEDLKQSLAGFEGVVSRIADAEASGKWKEDKWEDPVIRTWLAYMTRRVREQTGRDFVKLPVDFEDVKWDGKDWDGIRGDHSLHIAKDVDLAHVRDSIILADGNVKISHVSDSIIVAKGSVDIAHSNRNIILAGGSVDVSHDGNDAFRHGADPIPGRDPVPLEYGSTILCGKVMDISHAQGTICSAPLGLTISHARQVIYLNTPKRKVSWEHEVCRDIRDEGMPQITTMAKKK